MNKLLRTPQRKRAISFFLLIIFVSEIITPTATYALTSGPSQPEVQAFTPVNTSEMVDLASGDFKYNIPLMDVGGYPLNIAYDSGVGMDQEASWVGLGWNLNVGAINRNMRGLPDDFNGEIIEKEINMKPNRTYGVNVGVGFELFGYGKDSKAKSSGKIKLGIALNYNNYNGIGIEQSANISINSGNSGKGPMNAGLGVSSSASSGLTVRPNLSYSAKIAEKQNGDEKSTTSAGITVGIGMNSRSGLKDLTYNASMSKSVDRNMKKNEKGDGYVKLDKEENISYSGGSVGSSINFGASSYIPQVQNSMVNNSFALNVTFGAELYGTHPKITIGGYFSQQSLRTNITQNASYGYMFSHNGQHSDDALMDFNREKDQAFSRYTKNLPITNQTFDVFSVSGQGIGGSYRPTRSEIGYVYDNFSTTTNDSYSGGVELGVGNGVHAGINLSVVDVHTNTGKWEDNNDAKTFLSAKSSVTSRYDYEPYYFKEVGEKSESEANTLYTNFGGDTPYRNVIEGKIKQKAAAKLEASNGVSGIISLSGVDNHLAKRQKRNQVLSTLNFEEAKKFGLDKRIYNGTHPTGMNLNPAAKTDHIAEITALRTDGSRYIYGLPAYNTLQKEFTFNVSEYTSATTTGAAVVNNNFLPDNGMVGYTAQEKTTGNKSGVDNYFNSVKLPAYAHSYLLTAIISPDYVDLTGDGPTDDDFGNYTKFEYTKVPVYNWRMPYSKNGNEANFNEVGKSFENDDQANFTYGTKELWFTTRIETKNYVAIFDLDDRLDAVGALGEDGGGPLSGAAKTKYIKTISLYSKPEYNANPLTAVPIKVVNFVYDYSLCQDIPNTVSTTPGQTGKLTLKQIYFTYGKSDKAKFSKYQFTYNQTIGATSNNFIYHPKAYDRWGNYMPLNNNVGSYTLTSSGSLPTPLLSSYLHTDPLTNSEFPYVDQFSKADADFRASAWNLTQIDLPSGGSIKVNYESDDYAFVQNRPAMQMMKVLNVLSTSAYTPAASNIGKLYDISGNNLFVHFELTENLPGIGSPTDEIRERYFKDINGKGKFLYFRFLVNLTNTGGITANKGNHFEYVSGYSELSGSSADCGITPSAVGPNGFPVAYVKLQDVRLDDSKKAAGYILKMNPIAKAAMNFGKTHYNNLIWDASFTPPGDLTDAIKQLAREATNSAGKEMLQSKLGPNLSLSAKFYCQEFVAGKSWIRLYNPSGHKFGGGARVKDLTMKDNWSTETGGQEDSEYGQEFTYETDFNGKTISSGVASYEPMLGGDENPFRQPVYMGSNRQNILIPEERFFMEEPFGESFFPSATIVYSKVKVKNKIPTAVAARVKTHGTGYVIHEFYTAKDFPTLTSHTSINPKQFKTPLGNLLKIFARDYVTASQGYVIKLNDMHGKPKGQSVFAEGTAEPITQVQYFYKTKEKYVPHGLKNINIDASSIPNELDNSCVVINPDGSISKKVIGVDFDAVADFRENKTRTISAGVQLNVDASYPPPSIVPGTWPDFSYEETRFRSSIFTKIITSYGILEKTIVKDLGSIVQTSNLAFDTQTGDVLVTKTKNDFEDEIYSLKYPAHWGYDLMGPAYKNIGYTESLSFSAGIATVPNASLYNVGDELALYNISSGITVWVCDISGSTITVMDKNGLKTAISGTTIAKVLRSGRRNLLMNPMSSLTSLVNPLDNDNNGINDTYLTINTNSKVLNTTATEYSDQWQTFMGSATYFPAHCEAYLNSNGIAVKNYVEALFGYGHPPSSAMAANTTNTHLITVGVCNYNLILSGSVVKWSEILTQYGEVSINWPKDCSVNELTVIGRYAVGPNPTYWMTPPIGYRGVPLPEQKRIYFTITPASGAPSPTCDLLTYNTIPAYASQCGFVEGDVLNPFVYNIKGNWRPKITWSYLNERTQSKTVGHNNLDIRKDGYVTSYSPFYVLPSSGTTWTKAPSGWTYTSEITKVNPYGIEVETKDALNRYSCAQYGECGMRQFPLAVASNAQLQEIAYDGFEDYDCIGGEVCSTGKEYHFNFAKAKMYLSNIEAHTGIYSMELNPLINSALTISKKITSTVCTPSISPICSYSLVCSDFIIPFSPITTGPAPKKYVLSYWVKEKILGYPENTDVLDYTNSIIDVSLGGGSGFITPGTLRKSEIIDGWQRFEYFFTISTGASGNINISLTNTSVSGPVVVSYFDDIRMHPFNSNMKSFVYNPVTLKYTAELDANNFATFYEYDEEGSLVRVKKETEKGIMTIQETKNHTKL